ncbi:MAG: sugar phosphate isomerase/epimerase [Planctomycetaceae bacterium]|jgi:L-ribulose-5-phosphate 3-epimerase|nr:sugar phosphate isomerase/epimerase [Planctomycetaceae bacterium]MBT6155123.1 sugar phosphate isomerase/epimerase [Planctomycetaceae bacterium]MBT6483361.1 sugar phosphate isomerase/epimerase [Planctomycetaceae bacterium]MBT6493843.1 sugar phosphate isomerase/epimerase [Planctomycetaceae bacterium]
MRLGYNTNGTSDHRWPEAVQLMAEIGYRSVAVTVDHDCLDPFSPRLTDDIEAMRALLEQNDMISVVETGARFLLNPRVKHEPTLMSATADERRLRVDFLKRCVDISAELGADAVSFWSGVLREDIPEAAAIERLAAGCREVCEYAATKDVRLAFEPEPGMFIETMADYANLLELVDAPHFGLTIDIGHLQCVEDEPISDHLRRWSDRLFNIHIEDMCRGVHEHLPFGEGEIDFEPVLSTLCDIGFAGGLNVELSRHSHMAPTMLQESYDFLKRILRAEGLG